MHADEKRTEAAELLSQQTRARAALDAHRSALDAEHAGMSALGLDAMSTFAAYKRQHARAATHLVDRLGKLSRSRANAEEALREACIALKRLELAEEARRTALAREDARKAEAEAEDSELIRAGAAAR